ncbi:hypothetical protein Tco_0650947 [Tanacetum coccineum]
MSSLAEFAILNGVDNRPPMLDKLMYDSWKSRMELYMENHENENSLKCCTEEETSNEADVKETNIILQGVPADVYALIDYQPQQTEFLALDSGLAVPVFNKGDDPIDAINKMMSFLSIMVTSRFPSTNNQLRNSSNPRQQATIQDGRVTVQAARKTKLVCSWFIWNKVYRSKGGKNAFSGLGEGNWQTKIALMANLSHYGSDALAEVNNHDNVDNNLMNQVVQAMSSSEQSSVVNNSETEITSDSNIIPYSQIVIRIHNMTTINLDNKSANDTLTVELERYKEQVKVLKEGQNVDLKKHLKEKESLMQTVTLLKNDFKKEESRNIDREIAFGKERSKASFQNPFYLKKAQQLEPKLYDGNVIKNTSAIVIPDSEETLMLAEENHTLSNRSTKVEVPKELPKVSMVNMSLKKLKHHLTSFDVEKDLVITALNEELRKLKGKSVVACHESVNKPKVITPIVHKVDLEPLSPKLKNNREAHVDYIMITKENADTLRDIVEQARTLNPLDNALAYACRYTKQIHELLVYVSDTCPSSSLKSEKLVAVTPMNKARKVTFAKTTTTLDNNTPLQVDCFTRLRPTSKPLVPSTNDKCSTNASISKPRSETKNHRIMQPLSSNQKSQKIEALGMLSLD